MAEMSVIPLFLPIRRIEMRPRTIAFLLFPGALALDVTGPAEVFSMANRFRSAQSVQYRLRLLSMAGGLVETASGISINCDQASDTDDIDTLIVSGGLDIVTVAKNPKLVAWVRTAAPKCRRVCSVCTGAFLLAAAGLLDGRRAVTHWGSGAAFRASFPDVKLDLQPIYIQDGNVWTSAGVTAGIDLALALVEADLGRSTAISIAKELVVFLHRPGGQPQFSSTLTAQSQAAARDTAQRFGDLHAWIIENLNRRLSVDILAAKVNMAPRTFARVYATAMGTTPAKAVEELRLEAARCALEQGCVSVKVMAGQCGFGNEERLRRSFARRYGIPPSRYRERFGSDAL